MLSRMVCAVVVLAAVSSAVAGGPGPETKQQLALYAELAQSPHRVLFESNRSGNWDIWSVNPDGTDLKNITRTPDLDEIHVHAAPDGSKLVFIGDKVETVRGVVRTKRATYISDPDGGNRVKVGDMVQQAVWNHDATKILLVRSNRLDPSTEYDTYDLLMYDVKTGKITSIRPDFFRGIFALAWSPDDQWIIFAQHRMNAFKHQILVTDTAGRYLYPVENYGCRPDFSPMGDRIAWNTSDQHIATGIWDPRGLKPGRRDPLTFTDIRTIADVPDGKIYYVDWSPDAKYFAYARATMSKESADHGFKGVGNWRIHVTRSTGLTPGRPPVTVPITSPPDGVNDKEPDWLPVLTATSRPARTANAPMDRAVADFIERLKKLESGSPR